MCWKAGAASELSLRHVWGRFVTSVAQVWVCKTHMQNSGFRTNCWCLKFSLCLTRGTAKSPAVSVSGALSLSSHTPWADCYLCSLSVLILWEPYIKKRPVWEERTGILSVLWSLMQFSAWGSLSLSVQRISHQSCSLSHVRLLKVYSFLLYDHSVWSSFVRVVFTAVFWGYFWLTLVPRIWCPPIFVQKMEEQCSSIALCRTCSHDLLVKLLQSTKPPYLSSPGCFWSGTCPLQAVSEFSRKFLAALWSEAWSTDQRKPSRGSLLPMGAKRHSMTQPFLPPLHSSRVAALRVQNHTVLEGGSWFQRHPEKPKISANHCWGHFCFCSELTGEDFLFYHIVWFEETMSAAVHHWEKVPDQALKWTCLWTWHFSSEFSGEQFRASVHSVKYSTGEGGLAQATSSTHHIWKASSDIF